MSDAVAEPVEDTPPPVLQRDRARPRPSELVQRHLVPVLVATAVALLVGVAVGRVTAGPDDTAGRAVIERSLVPLVVDADATWTAAGPDRVGVAVGLLELRRDDDPSVVLEHGSAWIDEYDTTLRRLIGVEVPPELRAVQRQFVNAVTLSRDAVEVLIEAANTPDPGARRELSSEAVRLRTRAEHLNQSARASVADLGEAGSGVSVPPQLPSLQELRGTDG